MEFFRNIFNLPLAEWLASIHGLLATLSLLIYGAVTGIILFSGRCETKSLHKSLVYLLGVQTLLVGLVSTLGIVTYVVYRLPSGPQAFLLREPATAWLQNIVFEYKENLGGITAWLLMMVAFFVALKSGHRLFQNRVALRFILSSTIVSFIFLMLTSALAVLVTKAAPLQNFLGAQHPFNFGGNTVLLAAFISAIVVSATFWQVTRKPKTGGETGGNQNPLAAVMYGSAVGLTIMWILNIAKEASQSLADSITYINSIGHYGGILIWSLASVVIITAIIRLSTTRARPLSLNAAGITLIICALIQIVTFFPPFYELFISQGGR